MRFRNDVQVFLDGCQPAGKDPYWNYYEQKKHQLSAICGEDSEKETCDMELFSTAMKEMTRILGV